MNIVRDVYIFSIFESYIYIVNYSINYGRYMIERICIIPFHNNNYNYMD